MENKNKREKILEIYLLSKQILKDIKYRKFFNEDQL